MTPGGDDLLHDHIDDDLEVLIDDLTDAQVRKFNFFQMFGPLVEWVLY